MADDAYDMDLVRFIHSGIDNMVEDLAKQMNVAAEKHGIDEEEFRISEYDKAEVRRITKEIVPDKPPYVVFMIIQVLNALIQWSHKTQLMQKMQENPDEIIDMINSLVESPIGEDVLRAIEERANRFEGQFKNIGKGNSQLKVADLGDVMDTTQTNIFN